MNQEETKKAEPEETTSAAENADAQEIDNLPIESIGSYARIEELLDDETADETSRPPSGSRES